MMVTRSMGGLQEIHGRAEEKVGHTMRDLNDEGQDSRPGLSSY